MATTGQPVGSKVKTVTGVQRVYSMKEVAQHNKDDDVWIVIHGKVYDVNGFLEDHPGGPEILQQKAGQDATQDFDEVFHSDDAKAQLKDFIVGSVEGYVDKPAKTKAKAAGTTTTSSSSNALLPLVGLVIVAAAIYFFVF